MQASRTFRVFVSSTFRGLEQERDALQRHVFPRLRDLCLRKGTRFLAVDLRWGVSEEAGLDQQTVTICLSEIERCRRPAGGDPRPPRPNFIVLLGDRYGWCPPPPQVPAEELEHLRALLPPEDLPLLDAWYERDDNAVPPEYVLKEREGPFRDFTCWAPVEQRLRAVLQAAARAGLPEPAQDRYRTSVTEQEIVAGVLSRPDAREHVFGFFRTIARLPEDGSAGDFLDLDASSPAWCRQRLADLKARLASFPLLHIDTYEARWGGGGITTDHIGSLPERLEDCLALLDEHPTERSTTLCVDVWRRLAGVILAELAPIETVGSLEAEIAAHARFAAERAPPGVFTGRTAALERIRLHLRQSEGRPLVVEGAPGCGKSALLARAAQIAEADAPGDVVVRFIGATPVPRGWRAIGSWPATSPTPPCTPSSGCSQAGRCPTCVSCPSSPTSKRAESSGRMPSTRSPTSPFWRARRPNAGSCRGRTGPRPTPASTRSRRIAAACSSRSRLSVARLSPTCSPR
jgi:hypothetical protein